MRFFLRRMLNLTKPKACGSCLLGQKLLWVYLCHGFIKNTAWITLGNQVDGVRLVDPDLIGAFKKRYPDGNCMAPPPPDPGLA
ncbi:hypothetical protein HW555_001170 [Spodoptera exigua]|uniref:Uncharacterized protein n=1 Tax=Spodoptera exigua TaxID=7107 RepID=A0A835LBD1_SPOEX|nr:hypothetical protein HW555_001170 [Spodoptera exigua]